MMKVAVCTSDGKKVDLHFGRTDSFYIYEFNGSELELSEVRDVTRYCKGFASADHKFQTDKFNRIYDAIQECQTMFTVKIGDAPKAALLEKGLKIVECEAAISSLTGMME
jgi:predicted Fe-Mo cluster-binding NifX family protein